MDEAVVADGAEDARAGGGRRLDGNTVRVDDVEDVREVAAVEGDLGLRAFDDGVQDALVVADFLGAGSDVQAAGVRALAGRADDGHDAGADASEERGAAGPAEDVGDGNPRAEVG